MREMAKMDNKNMWDEKRGYFYIYENRVDRMPYIRLGQAWISYLVGGEI